MPLCGGASIPSQPTDEDLNILLPVIEKYLEEKCEQKPSSFKITEISRQVVAGVNYFVKVEHGGEVWHIRVHRQLPSNGGLVSVHSHKAAQPGDALTYF